MTNFHLRDTEMVSGKTLDDNPLHFEVVAVVLRCCLCGEQFESSMDRKISHYQSHFGEGSR